MRDFYNSFNIIPLLNPQLVKVNTNSKVYNRLKERGEQVVLLIALGKNEELTSDNTLTLILEHSMEEREEAFEPVLVEDLLLPASLVKKYQARGEGKFLTLTQDAPQIFKIRYIGGKPYLRVRALLEGEHTTGTPLMMAAFSSPLSYSPLH